MVIERRVAEKSCLWLWWMRIIPRLPFSGAFVEHVCPDGRGDAHGEFQRAREALQRGDVCRIFYIPVDFRRDASTGESPC